MSWITPADLDRAYDAQEVTRLADVDGDGQRDPGVVENAIRRAEGRVRSRLLTRYQPEDLPEGPERVPEPLRRVAVDLAYYELHKLYEQLPDSALRIRDDALAELNDLVAGLSSLDLENRPPVDATRPLILSSASRRQRLTLGNLD